MAALAMSAGAAANQRFDGDAVALAHADGFGTDGVDDTAHFVSRADARQRGVPAKAVQVAAADAAALDAHPNLALARSARRRLDGTDPADPFVARLDSHGSGYLSTGAPPSKTHLPQIGVRYRFATPRLLTRLARDGEVSARARRPGTRTR